LSAISFVCYTLIVAFGAWAETDGGNKSRLALKKANHFDLLSLLFFWIVMLLFF